jgi:dienelactone hydrolase
MTVPNTPDLFDDALDGPRGGAAPLLRNRVSSRPSATRAASGSGSGDASAGIGGILLLVLGAVLFAVFRMTLQGPVFGGGVRPGRRVQAPPQIVIQPVDLDGPIAMPSFPDLVRPHEIEPGVYFQEVHLPGGRPSAPGHSGRLWLFLPAAKGGGRPAPGSLPCVLFAPAGSITGLTGMKLADGDRPEILPYVHAGFAVLAFELDGAEPDGPRRGTLPWPSMQAFLHARAGLVNGEVALAFLKAKVPEVDRHRLYVAGHSSAATFALVFAEHSRDLKGCVAYAPDVDLAGRRDDAWLNGLSRRGFGPLLTRFSPRAGEADLKCPVYLFHARDDDRFPSSATAAFADRLRGLGKTVTFDLVDGSDHYETMIRDGLPRGVAWLKARDAEVVAGKK